MLAWLVLYRNQINVLPVCVDSSDSVTKRSGLEAYYQTAIDPETKLPIVNLLNIIESELILNLKKITILTRVCTSPGLMNFGRHSGEKLWDLAGEAKLKSIPNLI